MGTAYVAPDADYESGICNSRRHIIAVWRKKIGGFGREIPETVQVGDMLDFFLVEYISDQVLTLTARDKHLDVMTCVSVNDRVLAITSSVKTHNFFGRVYMVPVGVAHKIIVRNMLKRLKKQLNEGL